MFPEAHISVLTCLPAGLQSEEGSQGAGVQGQFPWPRQGRISGLQRRRRPQVHQLQQARTKTIWTLGPAVQIATAGSDRDDDVQESSMRH